jgi:hypothetical protein
VEVLPDHLGRVVRPDDTQLCLVVPRVTEPVTVFV